MSSYNTAALVTAVAVFLAENLNEEQLSLLACAFTQLGDTLETILIQRSLCKPKSN